MIILHIIVMGVLGMLAFVSFLVWVLTVVVPQNMQQREMYPHDTLKKFTWFAIFLSVAFVYWLTVDWRHR